MTIEFQTAKDRVKEWVMTFLLNRIMGFHYNNEDISRAQIAFRDNAGLKSCAIDLIIYGHSLFVNRSAGSYEEASIHALKEIDDKLKELSEARKELPTEMVSTVVI